MKTILSVLMLFAATVCLSQDNAIDKYFKDFEQKNSLDKTIVSSKMFNLLVESKEGKEKSELSAILKKLTGLKILSKQGPANGLDLYNSACALMPAEYESILVLKETDRNARFYTKENEGGKIIELVMIAFQWGRFIVVSITGDINLSDILKLSQNLNLQGFEDVQKQKVIKQ